MPSNVQRPHIIIKNEPKPAVTREYDGGGGGTYPRESYRQHATKVHTEVDKLKAIFSNLKDAGIEKRYFKVVLPEGEKVSTSTGKGLEKSLSSNIVGSPQNNVAHVSSTVASFDDLVAQLENYKNTEANVGKSKYAMIEEISSVPFDEKVSERFLAQFEGDEEEGEALITFFPDLNENETNTVKQGVEKFLSEMDGEVLSFLPREEGALIKVRSKKSVLKDLAEMFVSIQSLDSVDDLIMEMTSVGEPVNNSISVNPNSSQAFACMFDTGVSPDVRYLQGSIIEDYCPFGDNKGMGTTHGTFVASRIVYGDSIKDQISMGALSPDVRLLSVCTSRFDDIGNKKRVTIDELISLIRRTVEKWHQQIRVYNLSLSCIPQKTTSSPAIRDDVVHQLASEIDYLSRKYDVLFVLCTGNIPYSEQQGYPDTPYPSYFEEDDSRIMSPGEAMLGLTVGSIALEEAAGSMAKKEEPSPFTRRGPGFAGYYKPDLVAHGGNCGKNWSEHQFLNVTGFSDNGGNLSYARGTSFSAPIVTRLAAKIFEILPTASACLVKAMLIHFCQKIGSQNFEEEALDRLRGHGFPITDLITASTQSMQSFLYQGEMDYRDMVEIPFYVPSVLIDRKVRNKVKIKVTISFYPETSAVLKSGYCKSHIRTKIIKLDKSGQNKDVGFSTSSVLNEERYSTVIKMEKVFSSAISSGEWKILVAHESRWTLRNPNTKFAVVVTVEDPENDPNIDIYSAIRQEEPVKYRTELGIQERIRA